MNIEKIPSEIADTARGAVSDVGEAIGHTRDAGVATASSAIDATSDRLRKIARIAGAYASLRTILRVVETASPGRQALRMLGLQRKPSAASRVAAAGGMLALGAAAGAAVALVLAPRTGAQLRARLARGFQALRRDASEVVATVEVASQDVVNVVERAARDVRHSDAMHALTERDEPVRLDGARKQPSDATKALLPPRV